MNFKHPIFVLDFSLNGYGVTRTFSAHGIKVYGFLPQGVFHESHTRLAHKIIRISDNPVDYLETLLKEAEQFKENKPFLLLTSDLYQDFVKDNYEILNENFILYVPEYSVLKHFLEKDLFNILARKNDILIPLSFEVYNLSEVKNIIDKLPFPLLIKPAYRDSAWVENYTRYKVFIAKNKNELLAISDNLFDLVDKLIMQEWVPGPDSNIYYCMAFITKEGEVISSFTGRKIHQYPILKGNTASAEAVNEPEVEEEALRILKLNGNYGLCSVEFKKHSFNGKFYVIEPTVGRINQQEFTAALNGNDITLEAYCYLTKTKTSKPHLKVNNFYFIEEISELEACFHYASLGQMNWISYFKFLKKRKLVFMFINYRDPLVSLLVLVASIKHIVFYLWKRKPQYNFDDEHTAQLFQTFENKDIYFAEINKTVNNTPLT